MIIIKPCQSTTSTGLLKCKQSSGLQSASEYRLRKQGNDVTGCSQKRCFRIPGCSISMPISRQTGKQNRAKADLGFYPALRHDRARVKEGSVWKAPLFLQRTSFFPIIHMTAHNCHNPISRGSQAFPGLGHCTHVMLLNYMQGKTLMHKKYKI